MTKHTITVPGAVLFAWGNPGGVTKTRWEEPPATPDAELAAARALADLIRGSGGQLLVLDRPDRQSWLAAVASAGFTVHRRKLFARHDLVELPDGGAEFGWRPLSAVPESEFISVMAAASQGDPFEAEGERDHEREWRELVEGTGDALDPDLWRLALEGGDGQAGEVVGVVLPKVWREPDPPGTLAYIGIVPAHRGRGLGRRLHAWGLRLVKEAGAVRYVGSTDERNVAMARTFERNGCRITDTQVFLTPPK